MARLLYVFFLMLLVVVTLAAQQVDSKKKFIVVNEWAFYDKKTGIEKLVKADKVARSTGFIAEKDPQKSKEIFQSTYNSRKKHVIDPVLNEISEALRDVSNKYGLVVLNMGDMAENSQVLAVKEEIDITKRFIEFFNKKSKGETATFEVSIPDSKLASIDTRGLFANGGLKLLREVMEKNGYTNDNVCERTSICTEIGKAVQAFADTRGYSLVFDSSRSFPDAVKDARIDDVTKDFISYFNNR